MFCGIAFRAFRKGHEMLSAKAGLKLGNQPKFQALAALFGSTRSATLRANLVLFIAGLLSCGCRHQHGSVAGYQTWPPITAGCERVLLFLDGQTAPFEYRTLEVFHGHWDEPDKNLRNWIVNKACAAGADAVVNVVETVGVNEDGGREWNIHGEAVLFDRRRPQAAMLPQPQK